MVESDGDTWPTLLNWICFRLSICCESSLASLKKRWSGTHRLILALISHFLFHGYCQISFLPFPPWKPFSPPQPPSPLSLHSPRRTFRPANQRSLDGCDIFAAIQVIKKEKDFELGGFCGEVIIDIKTVMGSIVSVSEILLWSWVWGLCCGWCIYGYASLLGSC